MNIIKIVKEDDRSSHIVTATILSEATEATDKIEERCDEIRKMMKGIKIYDEKKLRNLNP